MRNITRVWTCFGNYFDTTICYNWLVTSPTDMKFFVTKLILMSLLWSPMAAAAAENTSKESSALKEEIVAVLMEADNRFSEGEYSSAESLYKRLAALAPKNREGYLGLGRIEFLRGDSKQALDH